MDTNQETGAGIRHMTVKKSQIWEAFHSIPQCPLDDSRLRKKLKSEGRAQNSKAKLGPELIGPTSFVPRYGLFLVLHRRDLVPS